MRHYLKKLTLRNFQCYEHAELLFHKHVNVIFGVSDEGKSALLRGIELAAFNKPAGAKYYSDFARRKGKMSSRLLFSDGNAVKLVRNITVSKTGTKKVTRQQYFLDKKSYSGLKKSGIPDKVVEAVNLDSINIQDQEDAAFILDQGGGAIAKTINKVTGLGFAVELQEKVTTKIKSIKSKITFVKTEIETAKKKLEPLKNLAKLEREVKKLSEFDSSEEKLLSSIRSTERTIEEIKSNSEELRQVKKQFNEGKLLLSEYRKLPDSNYKELEELLRKYEITGSQKDIASKKLSVVKHQYLNVLKNRCPVCFTKNIDLDLVRKRL